MKTTVLFILLQSISICCFAQSLSYTQVVNAYNTWVDIKGKDYKPLSSELKLVSSKWKLASTTPTIEDDTRYFSWNAEVSSKDEAAIAAYLEEDSESVKYSIRYVFTSATTFQEIKNVLLALNSKVNQTTYNSKDPEFLTTDDSRTIVLKKNSDDGNYTFDIWSKYIKK